MRQTKQRERILAALQTAEGPLSVERIHERARRTLPELGIATVYRTLKLLLAQGQIVAVAFPGEEPHYEPAGRGHHHHFRCRGCARWFELPTCLVPHLEQLTLREGYVIEAHELTLYGRCPRCASAT
jgi:Fur family ferric uptake transcriptional regulator